VNPEEQPRKLRPTQIAVVVLTAFMMALTAILFGYGVYCILNPDVITDDGTDWGAAVGVLLILGALIPAGGTWGLWMLWNDLAARTPGSAKGFPDKPDADDPD
jgi:hypothetical protein